MATILEFRGNEKSAAKARRGRRSAQIVIFPGVRYERWDESAASQSGTSQSASVQRDRLELVD
jgi:hypothetical protein